MRFLNKHIFDYLLILVFVLITITFAVYFLSGTQYTTVVLKVTEKDVLYARNSPQSWFVYLFKEGMTEKDGLGKISAKINDVYYYQISPDTSTVYLTLSLKSTVNRRTKEHNYKGATLAIGESLRISFTNITVQGLIVQVDGLSNPTEEKFISVEGLLFDQDRFSETTGVEPFVADAINQGDTVLDSKGAIIAEVLNKRVEPAKKNTFDYLGNVYERRDPRKKDVYLTLKLKVKNIQKQLYFLDTIKLNVGTWLPLNFKNITIYPAVTKIIP